MSLPRYPEYKDSGVPWLGAVPAHWGICTLKRVASLRSGESITADSIETEGPYPVYGGNGLRGYTDGFTHEGDFVLVGRQGALCGNVNYANGRFWASEHAVVVTPVKQASITWLGELLRAANLGQYSVSAAQPGLSVDAIASLGVPYPPIGEQLGIARFLGRETARIDALIAEQEKLLALLAEKRQATISHAVTRGLDPNVPMKDSGIAWLGEVPAHWEVRRLRVIATVQTGIAKGKDVTGKPTIRVPYLRVANVQDGYLDLDEIAEIEIEPDQLSRYRLELGDVLMNEGGDFDKLGRGAIWNGEVESCIHQNHVFAVRPHSVSPQWLTLVTGSAYAQFYFKGRAKQSTNLASISSTNVMELPVVLPPAAEQESIVEFIREAMARMDALTAAASRAVELLRERRGALISAAVTGQIDVGGLVEMDAG